MFHEKQIYYLDQDYGDDPFSFNDNSDNDNSSVQKMKLTDKDYR